MHTIVKDPRRDDPKNFNFDYEETCPLCENEVYIRRDPEDPTFSVVCPHCGNKLMLCSLCIDTFGECSRKNGKCICEAEPRDTRSGRNKQMKNNQFRIIADEKHVDKINEVLKSIQGRATARILSAEKILDILKRVESRLNIPKKDLDGVQVVFTFAETFPNAYRYTPESTHFSAVYGNRHWTITNIRRSVCPDRNNNISVVLTENAAQALLSNMRSFRV